MKQKRMVVVLVASLMLVMLMASNTSANFQAFTGTGRADFMWCSDVGCAYRADSWSSNTSSTWTQTGTSSWTITKSESFGCYSTDRPWEPVVMPTQVNYYDSSSKSTNIFTAYQTSYSSSAICPQTQPVPFNGTNSSSTTVSTHGYIAPLTTYGTDGSTVPQYQGSEWSTAQYVF